MAHRRLRQWLIVFSHIARPSCVFSEIKLFLFGARADPACEDKRETAKRFSQAIHVYPIICLVVVVPSLFGLIPYKTIPHIVFTRSRYNGFGKRKHFHPLLMRIRTIRQSDNFHFSKVAHFCFFLRGAFENSLKQKGMPQKCHVLNNEFLLCFVNVFLWVFK